MRLQCNQEMSPVSQQQKTFLFDPSAEPYRDLAIVPTLEWRCKGDFGHLPDTRKEVRKSVTV